MASVAARLVELRRVEGRVDRRAHLARARRRRGRSPPTGRRPAARSSSPPRSSRGGRWPGRWPRPGASTSARLPAVELVPPRVPPGHRERAEEAAVEDAAALEQAPRSRAGASSSRATRRRATGAACADQAADQNVDGHVGDDAWRRGPPSWPARLTTHRPARKARREERRRRCAG